MAALPPLYSSLARALRERIAVIGDRDFYQHDPAGHLERLKAISAEIIALQQQLPPPVDPKLAHYLERCSYDKALAFIEGQVG